MDVIQRAPEKFLAGAPAEVIDVWFSQEHQHYYFLLSDACRSPLQRAERRLARLSAVKLQDGTYSVSETSWRIGKRPNKERRIWMLLPSALQRAVKEAVDKNWNLAQNRVDPIM